MNLTMCKWIGSGVKSFPIDILSELDFNKNEPDHCSA